MKKNCTGLNYFKKLYNKNLKVKQMIFLFLQWLVLYHFRAGGEAGSMSSSEKELIKRAKKGDVEAFEQLIEGCQKKVFNIALRMLGNYDDASELAQEVFLKAYKSIKNFKGDSLFNTWIYKVTTNACLDEIRKRKNKKVVYLDEDIELGGNEIKRQIKDDWYFLCFASHCPYCCSGTDDFILQGFIHQEGSVFLRYGISAEFRYPFHHAGIYQPVVGSA